MNRETIKNILDKTNINAKDEIEILEFIDELINKEKRIKEYLEKYIEIDKETGTYSVPYTFDGNNIYKVLNMLEDDDE